MQMCARGQRIVGERTLNAYVDVVLRLLSLASVLIGFGEGVCFVEFRQHGAR